MKVIAIVGFLAVVAFQISSSYGKEDVLRPANAPNSRYVGQQQKPASISPQPVVEPAGLNTVLRPETAELDASDPHAVIRAVSAEYSVPAGLLFGIWNVESRMLPGGYGKDWRVAHKLARPGGECLKKYEENHPGRCAKWWRGLQTICKQKRNGKPICDISAVRTSEAFALGPMQLLPSSVVLGSKKDGSIKWNTDFAADFDADGVIDPHSLPDAMAMAAKHLRYRYDRKKNVSEDRRWIWTASAYFGKQNSGYYEGFKNGNPGVQGYWNQWCKTYGCERAPAKRAIRT